jgi:hypothetical protein
MNDGKKTIAVFLDLAKAFDTVPHDALLETLSRYGIRGPVLDVFRSYLDNRLQSVKMNDQRSDPQVVRMGVPQGTVLGPLLFIIYINSLLKEIHMGGNMLSYADDTVLTFTGNTWAEVKNIAEKGLNLVKTWLDSNKLSLNIQKTNYIAFTPTTKNRPAYSLLRLNNNAIHEV